MHIGHNDVKETIAFFLPTQILLKYSEYVLLIFLMLGAKLRAGLCFVAAQVICKISCFFASKLLAYFWSFHANNHPSSGLQSPFFVDKALRWFYDSIRNGIVCRVVTSSALLNLLFLSVSLVCAFQTILHGILKNNFFFSPDGSDVIIN